MLDEFICDTPQVRQFIGKVKESLAQDLSVKERLAAIRPYFSQMLDDRDWLPEKYRQEVQSGGMGQGIANWLLYRDAEGGLSFSALVLPPGVATPVHDHLAWGLVGLYEGEQDEEVYAPAGAFDPDSERADLKLVEKNHLTGGSLYELIPPRGDIHRVITTSTSDSISLHLLANDVGCVLRHVFQPETGGVRSFQSHYSNFNCDGGGIVT